MTRPTAPGVIYVGVVALTMGVAIAAIWAWIIATGGSPELRAGTSAIRFHLAAEWAAAVLLVAGGFGLLVHNSGATRVVAGVGLGAALYTTMNSPGYYADLGKRGVVIVFMALALICVSAVCVLLVGG